jgi:hypothetical protein
MPGFFYNGHLYVVGWDFGAQNCQRTTKAQLEN